MQYCIYASVFEGWPSSASYIIDRRLFPYRILWGRIFPHFHIQEDRDIFLRGIASFGRLPLLTRVNRHNWGGGVRIYRTRTPEFVGEQDFTRSTEHQGYYRCAKDTPYSDRIFHSNTSGMFHVSPLCLSISHRRHLLLSVFTFHFEHKGAFLCRQVEILQRTTVLKKELSVLVWFWWIEHDP